VSRLYRELILFFIHLSVIATLTCESDLSVASVNLWNIMFLWEVRRRGIARAMRSAGVDVIVMQEVRVGAKLSQIDDLQLLLPQV
jgi:hypothetical protein